MHNCLFIVVSKECFASRFCENDVETPVVGRMALGISAKMIVQIKPIIRKHTKGFL